MPRVINSNFEQSTRHKIHLRGYWFTNHSTALPWYTGVLSPNGNKKQMADLGCILRKRSIEMKLAIKLTGFAAYHLGDSDVY